MRLLLSGFEPFGGETTNPSWEVARAIEAEPPRGVEVTTLRLAVRGGVAFRHLLPAFEAGEFDAWLGLGQAEGRPALSVERVGVNELVDRGPDGTVLPSRALVEGGPPRLEARLPVEELAGAMVEAGAPALVSDSAGRYICNEVLYVMLQRHAEAGWSSRAGFIHLPYLPEQTRGKPAETPSMALATQLLGVRAAIECMRDMLVGEGG